MTSRQRTFATLYEEHYDEIHAFCARRVPWADSDDATADVFAVVWRRISDAEADLSRAWIFGIARNVIRNQWRSNARRNRLFGRVRGLAPEIAPGPEAIVVRRQHDERVIAALRQLTASDQELLMLSAWDDLSGPEIAEVLGVTANAVQQRLLRARRRLAKSIERSQPELAQEMANGGEL